MRVALAWCASGPATQPPLWLAQAAGCLAYANHEVQALDLNARQRREPLSAASGAELLLSRDPAAVLLVVERGAAHAAAALAAELKRAKRSVSVVALGPELREGSGARRLEDETAVDAGISGAVDDALPKLAGLFDATGRWIALPGVWVREASGLRRGPKAVPFTFDLDLSPPADFSWVEPALYDEPDTMPLEASRGCASTCDFCAAREVWAKRSFKSGDRIFTDASRGMTQQPRWKRLEFHDIDANGNPDSLRRFARMSAAEGWPARGIRWSMRASVRPEMEAGLLGTLAAGGCESIDYGVESGSARLRASIGKTFSDELAVSVMQATRAAGIRCRASFITGHPDETPDDFEATLRFLAAHAGAWDEARVEAARVEEPSRLWRSGKPLDADEALRRQGLARAACGLAEAAA